MQKSSPCTIQNILETRLSRPSTCKLLRHLWKLTTCSASGTFANVRLDSSIVPDRYLWRSLSDKYHSRQLKVLWTTGGALDKWRYFGQLLVLLADGDTSEVSTLSHPPFPEYTVYVYILYIIRTSSTR